jgi:hypothetical protein
VFTPFQQELRASTERKGRKIKFEDLDTIVVPAREDGFNEVFLGEDCWYKIPMSSSSIEPRDQQPIQRPLSTTAEDECDDHAEHEKMELVSLSPGSPPA